MTLGKSPRQYLGTRATLPPDVQTTTRAPTSSDVNYVVGTVWIDTVAGTAYFLTILASGVATWALASPGSSDVDALAGDSGTDPVVPTAGKITIAGGTNLASVGGLNTLTLNLDAAITLATSVSSPLYTVAAATDLAITAATGQDITLKMGDNAAANKVSFTDSDDAEVFAVDSNGALTFSSLVVTGAFTQTAGVVSISEDNSANAVGIANGTTARAVSLASSAAAHTVAVGSATGAASLDLKAGTGNFTLDGAASTTYTVGATTTTGTISIGGTAQTGTMTLGDSSGVNIVQIGSGEGATTVNIAGGATSAKVVNLATGAVANLVTVGSASGAASLDLLSGTGNFTLEGGTATTYTISGTGVNTGLISIGAGTGAQQLDLMTGGTGIKTLNIGTGAIGNVLTLGTVTGAASLDLLCGTGNFTLEGNVASTYGISATGANTGTITLSGGTGAQTTNIATGGTGIKTLNLATGAIGNVVTLGTVTGAASLDLLCGTGNFTLEGNVASTYDISSTGANTGTCTFASGTGARTVELGGGGTGIKTINIGAAATADVITIGDTTGAGSLTLAAGTGDITMSGNVKTLTAEQIVNLGTNLTVTQSPVCQSALTTAVAPTGTAADINLMCLQDGTLMEYSILGTQTILAPRMSSNGLAIELDNTDTDGVEYGFGPRANAKHSYTIGTDAAFFFSVTLQVVDLSGCSPLMMGFRKVEAYNATLADYTDYFCAGINSATSGTEVVLLDELNAGGQTITNSTTAWTGGDTGTCTINVLVSAAGVCTYTIDGGAPAVTNAVTFDNADVVMPFIYFLNGTDVAGEVAMSAISCGFQA